MFVASALVIFLALYNLTEFPSTWFDEGSHLHVPKTLVRFGVYADYSSEGFRYFGPTIGVGPTVMLPIAAMFKLFGVGLLQARLVMAVYLLLAIAAFYLASRTFGDASFAVVATALLVTSRGIALLENGRQLLGEVPGFFFIIAGLVLWFRVWERAGWRRLILIGVLFGLGMVTKYQYLLIFGPTLLLAWIANLLYYRGTPQRVFLIPGIVAGMVFGAWQVYTILYLGPATASENFALLREAAAGAATAFSPDLMKRSLAELLGPKVFFWAWIPALAYGAWLASRRSRQGQQWGILFLLALLNLVWYVFASISWLRYAFLGLAIMSLFVARFFYDAIGWQAHLPTMLADVRRKHFQMRDGARLVLLGWLSVMLVIPFVQNARDIVFPPFNAAASMAAYLDMHVSHDILIETWEPELGFLTDHNYHFPPASLLPKAVAYIWLNQPPPANYYDALQTRFPPYIVVGDFARWVQLYPADVLAARYKLETRIGGYELYSFQR